MAGVFDFHRRPDTYETKCSVSGRSDVHIFLKRSDLPAVDSPEENQGQDNGHHLCNQEAPPYVVDISGQGQEPGNRNQHDELTAQGNNQ